MAYMCTVHSLKYFWEVGVCRVLPECWQRTEQKPPSPKFEFMQQVKAAHNIVSCSCLSAKHLVDAREDNI